MEISAEEEESKITLQRIYISTLYTLHTLTKIIVDICRNFTKFVTRLIFIVKIKNRSV